jgi:hypothetical protein
MDTILLFSKHSAACRTFFQHEYSRVLTKLVCVDSKQMKSKVAALKVVSVPTLLVLFDSKILQRVVGVEEILSWIMLMSPPAVQPLQAPEQPPPPEQPSPPEQARTRVVDLPPVHDPPIQPHNTPRGPPVETQPEGYVPSTYVPQSLQQESHHPPEAASEGVTVVSSCDYKSSDFPDIPISKKGMSASEIAEAMKLERGQM